MVGYSTNEPVQLRAQGVDVKEFRVSKFVDLAANGVVSSEKVIAENPELVRRFARALARGIEYTIGHSDAAYRICLKYVENLDQADQSVQLEVLTTSIEFWRTKRIGYADPQAWSNMNDLLVQMGLLTAPLDVNAAFTNEFVP